MEATKEIREIISKDTSLCDHWAGGTCYFPDGFRKHNKNKSYPECRLNGKYVKNVYQIQYCMIQDHHIMKRKINYFSLKSILYIY